MTGTTIAILAAVVIIILAVLALGIVWLLRKDDGYEPMENGE